MLERNAEIERGDCTQNYKNNLREWVKFAIKLNPEWEQRQERFTKDELQEMLNILAGYFGATPQGREMLKPWLETTQNKKSSD